jgi:hypothetical protein
MIKILNLTTFNTIKTAIKPYFGNG